MLRNFIQRFWKADITKPAERWYLPEAEAQSWTMPDPATHDSQTKLYATLDTIGAVVDVITETCIDADFDIYDENEKEIEGHPFEELLKHPNEYDSRTEFLRGHFSSRKLYGNSYWFLSRANKNVPPDEIFILSPDKIVPAVDGRMGLKGYIYYPGNGDQIPLETYEILHVKSWNPYSRYIGLSAIVSLAIRAYGADAALKWNTRLFANNNARLPGILAFSEMIQDGDWEKMKREVTNAAEKRNNMMLRGVGKGGVEWMQGTATQKEMEFLSGLKQTEEAIYNRLAPGLYSSLQNTALTNGLTGMALFMGSTVQPLLRELTDKLNAQILPVYGNGYAEYEDVTPEDKAMKLAEISAFAQFHTVDEVRVEKFGNDPDPDPVRGKLFASQITADTGKPAPQPVPLQEVQQPPEVEEPEMEQPDMMDDEVKADLGRWKRKAIRAFGTDEATLFEFSHIPADMHAQIVNELKACKSVAEVADVFEKKRAVDSVLLLALAIEKAVGGG